MVKGGFEPDRHRRAVTLALRFALNLAPNSRYWFKVAAFAVNLLVCVAALALLTGGRRPRAEFIAPALFALVALLWFLMRLLSYAHILHCGDGWCPECR